MAGLYFFIFLFIILFFPIFFVCWILCANQFLSRSLYSKSIPRNHSQCELNDKKNDLVWCGLNANQQNRLLRCSYDGEKKGRTNKRNATRTAQKNSAKKYQLNDTHIIAAIYNTEDFIFDAQNKQTKKWQRTKTKKKLRQTRITQQNTAK